MGTRDVTDELLSTIEQSLGGHYGTSDGIVRLLIGEVRRLRAIVAAGADREAAYNVVETEARALKDYVHGPYAVWKPRMLVDAVLTLRELRKESGDAG
jgi:hypothetical protein